MRIEQAACAWLCSLVMVGVVWAQASKPASTVSPASLRKASDRELAEGFLFARYRTAIAKMALERPLASYSITFSGQPMVIDHTNAAQAKLEGQVELDAYRDAIESRGYAQLATTYLAKLQGECSPFDIVAGPVLIDQRSAQLLLYQNGLMHEGVIAGNAIVFEHARSPEVRLIGELRSDGIHFRIQVSGYAAGSTPANCEMVLTSCEPTGREFANPFYERALVFLSASEYGPVVADLTSAIQADSNFAQAYELRSMMRSSAPDGTLRNGALAAADAQTACELTGWRSWSGLAALASAYAEMGDWEAAESTLKRAIALAPDSNASSLDQSLANIRAKLPLRWHAPLHAVKTPAPEPTKDWTQRRDTAGASLTAVTEFVGADKDLQIMFKIQGVDPSVRLQLWSRTLSNFGMVGEVEADDEGRLMLVTPEGLAQLVGGALRSNFLPGEALEWFVTSEDHRFTVSARVFPNPLETYDPQSGYKLTAELKDIRGQIYGVWLEGFDAGSECSYVVSQRGSGESVGPIKLAIHGKSVLVILPGVYGRTGGVAELRVTGPQGTVSIELPWGDALD